MTAGFKAICKADAVGRRARRSEEEATIVEERPTKRRRGEPSFVSVLVSNDAAAAVVQAVRSQHEAGCIGRQDVNPSNGRIAVLEFHEGSLCGKPLIEPRFRLPPADEKARSVRLPQADVHLVVLACGHARRN